MNISRRNVFGATAVACATGLYEPVRAANIGSMLNGRAFGVEPNVAHDQSQAMQIALDEAARRYGHLFLEPGLYIASGLRISSALNLSGVSGQTRIVQGSNEAIIKIEGTTGVRLVGLTFDGQLKSLGPDKALVEAKAVRDLTISNCLLANSPNNGINLTECSGTVSATTVEACANAGIFSMSARGLKIDGNLITNMGDNGILVWQPTKHTDGTIITGNRIEKIAARSGGSGQNGNGINVFRAGNVIVSYNHISDCAFTAVRNNSGSNAQIIGNNCSRLGEVAIYSEFFAEGCLVANNLVDTAATGISITNFNEGGRLAVCQGNIVRNLFVRKDPEDERAVGISVEADTAMTGNVIEYAPTAGLWLGWGKHLRNVSATANVIRNCGIGISASVVDGARAALIANNIISGTKHGAIVGMDHGRPVTGDLTRASLAVHGTLTILGNVVS
jgi:uncharacterized secreted repeat protein (TIGR03808 family)